MTPEEATIAVLHDAILRLKGERDALVERVSVLEKALEKIERNVTGDIRVVIEIARAALRTSEEA